MCACVHVSACVLGLEKVRALQMLRHTPSVNYLPNLSLINTQKSEKEKQGMTTTSYNPSERYIVRAYLKTKRIKRKLGKEMNANLLLKRFLQ